MLHLLGMKSVRMFFLMYPLFAVLAQKGLELRSEEVINFSVCYSPWLLDASSVEWTSAGLGMVTWLIQVMCSAHQMFCDNSSSNQPEQSIW